MKLSEQEGRVLLAYQFYAELSVVEIAKRLRLKTHVIHHVLRKYHESGVLRRGAFINFAALGLELYTVYFSLSSQGVKQKSDMMKALVKHPQVAWLGELGGNFHYGVAFYARGSKEALAFLSTLSNLTKEGASKKELSVIHTLHFFSKSYLSAGKGLKREMITLQSDQSSLPIDEKDQKILSCLFQGELDSHEQIARVLGLPRTTIEYRLKRLQQVGIINRYVHYLSVSRLGYLVYRLLVQIRGLRSDTAQRLRSFAMKNPNVVTLSECLGPWEYEFGVEVGTARETVEIVERLQLEHGDLIEAIEILPIFSQTTSREVFSPKWPLYDSESQKALG